MLDANDFDRLMRVDLLSLMETAHLLLPVWKDEKFGRVVLIGSSAALDGKTVFCMGHQRQESQAWDVQWHLNLHLIR